MGGIATETWAIGLSPWQAILESTRPYAQPDPALGWVATPIYLFLLVSAGLALLLNGIAVAMVRVWNPSREEQPVSREGTRPGTGRASGGPNTTLCGRKCKRRRLNPSLWFLRPGLGARSAASRRPFRPSGHAACLGQPHHLAGDLYLGLWPEDPHYSRRLFVALRSGGGRAWFGLCKAAKD